MTNQVLGPVVVVREDRTKRVSQRSAGGAGAICPVLDPDADVLDVLIVGQVGKLPAREHGDGDAERNVVDDEVLTPHSARQGAAALTLSREDGERRLDESDVVASERRSEPMTDVSQLTKPPSTRLAGVGKGAGAPTRVSPSLCPLWFAT